ncbi:hypothetical protein ACFCT7_14085 [Fulvivirgaceae bacterium LMO-SS25]
MPIYFPIYIINAISLITFSIYRFNRSSDYKLSAESSLVARESSAGNSSGNVWLADVVKSYQHLLRNLNSCMEGLQEIGLGISISQPFNSNFNKAYSKMESFLSQSFYLEVLTNFLLRVSLENPYTSEGIDKSIVISIG